MPIPLLLGVAAAQSGANILGQGLSALSNARQNRLNRNFQVDMYNRQRSDAIADWNMQNEYNSPAAQMQRFRDAKLNPNLIYGTGSQASNAGPVRQSSVGSYTGRANQWNIGEAFKEGLSAYIDTKVKEAQVDNLREQNTVLQLEARLKDVYARQGEQDINIKNTMIPYNIEQKKAEINNLLTEGKLKAVDTDIKILMANPNFEKAINDILIQKQQLLLMSQQFGMNKVEVQKRVAEIQQIRTAIENMQKEGKLKDFELWLKDERGKASDWPGWMKPVADFFGEIKKAMSVTRVPEPEKHENYSISR